jgi:hypothetical protein
LFLIIENVFCAGDHLKFSFNVFTCLEKLTGNRDNGLTKLQLMVNKAESSAIELQQEVIKQMGGGRPDPLAFIHVREAQVARESVNKLMLV